MITRYARASEFLAAAGPFLGEREAEHNLFFGIGSTLLVDEQRGAAPSQPPYLATIERDGRVVGAMLMTPPRQLVISCLGPASLEPPAAALVDDLAMEIVDDLGRFDPPTPAVLGPVPIARAFARAWCRPRDLIARRSVAERIYRLERLVPPVGVSGTVRVATIADRDLLLAWMRAFMIDVNEVPDDQEARAIIGRALDHGQRRFFLWEDGGVAVSTAGLGGPTPSGLRVGPVYTPPEHRGHGYASAVTAAASQAAFDEGKRFVFLLTDLANPTSNKIYQAIGYEPVIDVDLIRFERPADPRVADR